MNQAKRIIVNVMVTYGRGLYALLLGLFCGRWTLLSLGQEDYGLLGVVGGLIGFVTFFNNLMASAVSRYYAFAVGEAQKRDSGSDGLVNSQRWFNVALAIHTVLPCMLIVVGYPVGIWAIFHYLVIPPEKLEACVWVWRFSCIACLVSMVNVPFRAMYNAKQEIVEITAYSIAATTFNAVFLYYMITHPGFWLVRYSCWSCGLSVIPQFVITIRAVIRFQECRFRFHYMFDLKRMKDLVAFAGGRMVSALSQVFFRQGTTVAVNKILGLRSNAAMTVGGNVACNAMSFSNSCISAFSPAITNAAGRGDYDQMRTLAYRVCKIATLALIAFSAPLIVEIDNIMVLWLKIPPEGASYLCVLILLGEIVNHLTDGHWISIFACGKVALFNLFESFGFFWGFLVGVFLMWMGFGISAVGYGFIAGHLYALVVKLFCGKRYCELSIGYWFNSICAPILVLFIVLLCLGFCVRCTMLPSFLRLLITTMTVEPILLYLSWVFVLEKDEKDFIVLRLRAKIRRILP